LTQEENKQTIPVICNVSLLKFCNFLQRSLFPTLSVSELKLFAEFVDLDGDKFIGVDDLKTFIGRETMFSNQKSDLNVNKIRDRVPLFPSKSLSDDECLLLTGKLKKYLKDRNASIAEFFHRLDSNQDGLITIDELQSGLLPIVPVPQYVVERFFAAMDKPKNGMIDLTSLTKMINKRKYIHPPVRFKRLTLNKVARKA
jgi:hypothetical protein